MTPEKPENINLTLTTGQAIRLLALVKRERSESFMRAGEFGVVGMKNFSSEARTAGKELKVIEEQIYGELYS